MNRHSVSALLFTVLIGLVAGCGTSPQAVSRPNDEATRVSISSVVSAGQPVPQSSPIFETGAAGTYLRIAKGVAATWAADATLVEVAGLKTNRTGHIEKPEQWNYTFVSQRYPTHAFTVQVDRASSPRSYLHALGGLLMPVGEWGIDSPKAMAILAATIGNLEQPEYQMRLRGDLTGQAHWRIGFSHSQIPNFLAQIDARTGEAKIIF